MTINEERMATTWEANESGRDFEADPDDLAERIRADMDAGVAERIGLAVSSEVLSGKTNDELAGWLENLLDESKKIQESIGRIEMVLNRRFDAAEATVLPSTHFKIERPQGAPQYDYNRLAKLREILPPEMIAQAYQPEREEVTTIREKWDGRTLNTWARTLGREVKEIVEDATTRKPGRVKVEFLGEKEDLSW